MKIRTLSKGSPRWDEAVGLVQERYAAMFGAHIRPDPDMFVTCSKGSTISACAGLTFAGPGPFFSERYLRRPVDETVSTMLSASSRRSVVEIGQLASRGGRSGLELVKVLPIVAWCSGMSFILCTATAELRGLLQAVDVPFVPLVAASPAVLTDAERIGWGRYYEQDPQTGLVPLVTVGRGLVSEQRCSLIRVASSEIHEPPELIDAAG
jgi:hypothetical protein